MSELEDDYYEFDEENYCITGRHRRKTYQLGDPIVIRVARANLVARQLDFALPGNTREERPPAREPARQRPARESRRGRRGNESNPRGTARSRRRGR
jgi:ribonuclease R